MNRAEILQKVARRMEEEFILHFSEGSSHILIENGKGMYIEGFFDGKAREVDFIDVYSPTSIATGNDNIVEALKREINADHIVDNVDLDEDYEYAYDDDEFYKY